MGLTHGRSLSALAWSTVLSAWWLRLIIASMRGQFQDGLNSGFIRLDQDHQIQERCWKVRATSRVQTTQPGTNSYMPVAWATLVTCVIVRLNCTCWLLWVLLETLSLAFWWRTMPLDRAEPGKTGGCVLWMHWWKPSCYSYFAVLQRYPCWQHFIPFWSWGAVMFMRISPACYNAVYRCASF